MSTDAIQMCCDIQPFLKIIKLIISLIQWSVPLVLIVLGTIDMFKAVASGDEKVAKDVQSTFIKRLIYGAVIFLVPFFVRLILNFVNDNLIHDGSDLTSATSWIDCWNGQVTCSENSNNTGNGGNSGNNTNNNGLPDYGNPSSGSNSEEKKKSCYVYHYSECNPKYSGKYTNTSNCSVSSNQVSSLIGCMDYCLANFGSDDNINYNENDRTCTCYIPKVNSIKYSSSFSSSYSSYDKYSCSNEVNCDGVNFTVSGLCSKVS